MSAARKSMLFLTLLTFVAFISLGLPDGLLGVASPSIRRTFGLPLNAIGTIYVTGTAGYFVSSVASGRLLARLGIGHLLALSSLLTAVALTGYALSPAWAVMVALSFVSGLGAGAIDAGLNNYVAANRSERLMQWLHASFGVGSTLGPIIMTTVLSSGLVWRWGYVAVALAQFILAAGFAATARLWHGAHAPTAHHAAADTPALLETLRQSPVIFSILIFAVYAGLEYSTGQWTYTLFVEGRDIAPDAAGLAVSVYWGMFTLGRILAGFITAHLGLIRLLRLSMAGAVAAAALLLWNPIPVSSVIAVGLLGFALAPIFPALVSNTAARVGQRHTPNTIGLEIAASSVGISILPALVGVLADRLGLEMIALALLVLAALVLSLYEGIRLYSRRSAPVSA